MLVSYRWLKELLPELKAAPEEVAEALSGVGLTVDAVHHPGRPLAPLEVVHVVAINRHPKLDKVRLVTVERGVGKRQEIVCGAANVPEPGGAVVLAPLGTHLPAAGFTIEPRKIGGVVSEGMLVSESELGVAAESDGILVLAGAASAGTPFLKVCPEADDTIFEIDVTPNRPDALGHVGVARDLAALYEIALRVPQAKAPTKVADEDLSSLVAVEVQDSERCPHYGAALVMGVSIGPSPQYMRWRLHRLGVRPISNVVDVTNWLLLEFGQPLHAFDMRHVRKGRIVVRRAMHAEPFQTLDGIDRSLCSDDLVIADGEGPVALAGVMGGADSEIKSDTQNVLLECAYFEPRGVRRTARRQSMHTESSHRFERGTDWGGVEHVLERAKSLLVELAAGTAVKGAIHQKAPAQPEVLVKLRSERLDQLLGVAVPFDVALSTLKRLGFSVRADTVAAQALVEVPSFRPDVKLEVDLIEEVARLRGLDRIPTLLPRVAPERPRQADKLVRDVARVAVELGLSEALSYAFVAKADLAAIAAPAPVVTLSNPLSEERSVLRTSLVPGLLEALKRARRRGESNARLFNTGACFLAPELLKQHPAAGTYQALAEDLGALPLERPSFAAVIAGVRDDYLTLKAAELDIYDAKGLVTELCERLTGHPTSLEYLGETESTRHLHPRGAARVLLAGQPVGVLGPLHPKVVERLDLGGSALVIELDLAAVAALGRRVAKFVPIPKLPAVTRDVSLVVDDDVSAGDVANLIRDAAGDLCESVVLQAVFTGGSVPEGHRSLTYRLVYRDPKAASDPDAARTLTDKEVDKRQEKVLARASKEFGATLRG